MSNWSRVLDAADITSPVLREDYTEARRTVARFRREAYVAVRLLVPPALVPDVLVATAFMHHTDNLLDSGLPEQRVAAFGGWEREVRAALAGSGAAGTGWSGTEVPLVRAMAHSAGRHPALGDRAGAFLDTALTDLEFTGFAAEADYQRYIDDYSLPALMVVACLLGPPEPEADGAYRAVCRSFIDGSQRLDFVNDLAEDLAADRLTVPEDVLKEHRVTRADLAAGRVTADVGALMTDLLTRARADLLDGRELVRLAPPANRPMVRALVGLELLTLKAAEAKGPGLLRGSARPSLPAAAALLLREYRAGR